MTSLNKELLLYRLDHFWGFGQYESQYWFIGMEEGGANEIQEVSKRLTLSKKLGSPELVDNFEYRLGIHGYGYERFFEGNVKLQRTWAKLIRAFLNIQNPNKDYSAQDIKNVQANNWGRKTSNNCLLDIFPLPSPSASQWRYGEWSDIDILQSRDAYKNALRAKRIASLRKRISSYHPKVVIFYGTDNEYLEIWEGVAEVTFGAVNNQKIFNNKSIYLAQNGTTIFVVTYQPNAVWNNQYWNNVGKLVYNQL